MHLVQALKLGSSVQLFSHPFVLTLSLKLSIKLFVINQFEVDVFEEIVILDLCDVRSLVRVCFKKELNYLNCHGL